MAKVKISEFNSNPALNTDIDSINIAEGCSPSGINDAIRELMAQLKDWQAGTSNDPMVIGSTGSLTLNQGTANGVAYLNGSKVVTSGSALTFDGSSLFVGATSAAAGKLVVKDTASSNTLWLIGRTSDGASSVSFRNAADSAYSGRIEVDATSGMQFGLVGGAEGMRLTSTGLGIGTSSPGSNRLYINAPDGTAPLTLNCEGGSDATRALNFNVAGDNYGKILVPSGSGGAMAFWTGGANAAAERARIDSSGNLQVGSTSFGSGTTAARLGAGNLAIRCNVSTTYEVCNWLNSNGQVGTISLSGTSTAYNTSSDYRLKENIAPMMGALATVAQLKPVTYTWKADGSAGQGFIAHELQEVVPDCVTGEKDAVDEDGSPQYQGIDTSFLVATLTAAIQELKAEFDAYKATHP